MIPMLPCDLPNISHRAGTQTSPPSPQPRIVADMLLGTVNIPPTDASGLNPAEAAIIDRTRSITCRSGLKQTRLHAICSGDCSNGVLLW